MPKRIIPSIFLALFLIFAKQASAAISFSISNPQASGDQITIDVSLSGLTSSSCPNGQCYLQAAFTSQNQTKYFGFTQNHLGDWYEYDGSPEKEYIKSTLFAFEPISGNWSGKLTIKANFEDSNYNGPGSYNIKAWRYTGNSNSYSGPSDNTVTVELTNPAPSPTPSPSPSNLPAKSSSTSKSPSPSTKNSPSPASSKKTTSVLGTSQSAEIAKSPVSEINLSASPTPSAEETVQESINKLKIAGTVAGSGAIVMGLSAGLYLWYKRKLARGNGDKESI